MTLVGICFLTVRGTISLQERGPQGRSGELLDNNYAVFVASAEGSGLPDGAFTLDPRGFLLVSTALDG